MGNILPKQWYAGSADSPGEDQPAQSPNYISGSITRQTEAIEFHSEDPLAQNDSNMVRQRNVEVITVEDDEVELLCTSDEPEEIVIDSDVEVIEEDNNAMAITIDDDDSIEVVAFIPVITLEDDDTDIVILDKAPMINSPIESDPTVLTSNSNNADVIQIQSERGNGILEISEKKSLENESTNSNENNITDLLNASPTIITLNDSAPSSLLPSLEVSFPSHDMTVRSAASPTTSYNVIELPSIYSPSINDTPSPLQMRCSLLEDYSFAEPSTSHATTAATNTTLRKEVNVSSGKTDETPLKRKNREVSNVKAKKTAMKVPSNSRSKASAYMYHDSANEDYFQSDVYKQKQHIDSAESEFSFNGGGSLLDGLSDFDREDSAVSIEWRARTEKMDVPVYPPSDSDDGNDDLVFPLPAPRKVYSAAHLRKMCREDNPLTRYNKGKKSKPLSNIGTRNNFSYWSMEYFNKFRSTVTQVAAQVSNALPGNPLSREYDVGDQVGSAGQGLYWKIYKAVKKSTKQNVSVWLFDKKDIDKWPKEDKDMFLTCIKRGVSELTRLRHPRLLVIEHAIEESRDSLAFATEPIFASLADCLGKDHSASAGAQLRHLKDFKLIDIEIKHGLLQLGEALAFLHIDARILHRNLCTESIIINDRGAWKLAGFEFCSVGSVGPNNQISFDSRLEWNERIPSLCQPNLDFMAPEYNMGGRSFGNSDIFSLGVLSYVVFHPKHRPPLEYKNRLDKFKSNIESFKSPPSSFFDSIPSIYKDDFRMCLNYSPDLRPDATQFTKIAFFDDPLVKTLNYFESLMQMDNNQKMQFFKSLPAVLLKFEKRPLLQKVMPWLAGEFTTPDLIPFILPSVFHITEQCSKGEFSSVVFPHLMPVFSMDRPYQIALLLLQRMELLLEKANDEDIKQYILPLIYNSITSETTRIQELCLSIVPNIGKLVDRSSMKTQLLPKLLKLATEGGVLAIRVQALVSLGKLLPTLESWMVTEQILPTLPKITSKEPGLLMAILGIYKLSFESESLSVGREQLAKSALPFLMASSVENTLNLSQFEQYIALIKAMLTKVETEQRSRLQQLSAGQEEQRGVANFDDVLKPSSVNQPKSLERLTYIGSAAYGSANGAPKTANTSVGNAGGLSLEEKKRLAAAQHGGIATTSIAPSHKPTLSQITSSTNFNPMGVTPSSNTSNMSSGFDFFNPLPNTVTSSSKGPVDLSDLFPTNSVINAPPMAQNNTFQNMFSTPTNSNVPLSSFESVTNGSNMSFPGPPRSSNQSVQRPLSAQNPLDSLLSFPQSKPTLTSGTTFGIAPPPPGPGGQFRNQSQNTTSKASDPFADLLR